MNTSDTFKAFNDVTVKNVERMTSFGELNARIFEKMATRQMDAMTLYMDHAMNLMKLASESKGYNEFFKGQVDATRDLAERMVSEGKTTMEVIGETRDEYRAWFEKSMTEVASELRESAPKA